MSDHVGGNDCSQQSVDCVCYNQQGQITVKGQIRQYDPKHPAAVAEDFKIPIDFPPKTVEIYADLNAKFSGSPVKNADDAQRLIQLLSLDIRYLAGAGSQWDKVGAEACGEQHAGASEGEGAGGEGAGGGSVSYVAEGGAFRGALRPFTHPTR